MGSRPHDGCRVGSAAVPQLPQPLHHHNRLYWNASECAIQYNRCDIRCSNMVCGLQVNSSMFRRWGRSRMLDMRKVQHLPSSCCRLCTGQISQSSAGNLEVQSEATSANQTPGQPRGCSPVLDVGQIQQLPLTFEFLSSGHGHCGNTGFAALLSRVFNDRMYHSCRPPSRGPGQLSF